MDATLSLELFFGIRRPSLLPTALAALATAAAQQALRLRFAQRLRRVLADHRSARRSEHGHRKTYHFRVEERLILDQQPERAADEHGRRRLLPRPVAPAQRARLQEADDGAQRASQDGWDQYDNQYSDRLDINHRFDLLLPLTTGPASAASGSLKRRRTVSPCCRQRAPGIRSPCP